MILVRLKEKGQLRCSNISFERLLLFILSYSKSYKIVGSILGSDIVIML